MHAFPCGHAGQSPQPQPVVQPFGGATQLQVVGAITFPRSVTFSQISVPVRQNSGPHGNVPLGAAQPTVADRSTPATAAAQVLG